MAEGGEHAATPPAPVRHRKQTALVATIAIVAFILTAAFVGVAISTEPIPDEIVYEEPDDPGGLQGCASGNWPPDAVGISREFSANPRNGAYIWLDFDGWHIRNLTSAPIDGSVFAIGADAIRVPGDESSPRASVVPTALHFDLDPSSPDEGVDFAIGCDHHALTFDLRSAGEPLPADQIFLGPNATLSANPFTVQRELPL